jgi:hypothetical protein
MLDELQRRGLLKWRWDYNDALRTAYYWIAIEGVEKRFETRSAEDLVQRLCDSEGIVWKPVSHPGDEAQRKAALAWIRARKAGGGHS